MVAIRRGFDRAISSPSREIAVTVTSTDRPAFATIEFAVVSFRKTSVPSASFRLTRYRTAPATGDHSIRSSPFL